MAWEDDSGQIYFAIARSGKRWLHRARSPNNQSQLNNRQRPTKFESI